MVIKEIFAKNILSKSKIYDYTLNPYIGCQYACNYCYARFMRRFTGHIEDWGNFIDIKINAKDLLNKEITKKFPKRVWISGICDPYQRIEEKYELTRKCLEVFIEHNWPVTIQTKSPLILRDIYLLKKSKTIEVCFTITTLDERIRKIFEPNSPLIEKRINALNKLHSEGIKTIAMIAPILPGVEGLVNELKSIVDYVIIDKMNYHYADWVYLKYKINWAKEEKFFINMGRKLKTSFEKENIPCQLLF